jgi:hypothetical protein
MAKKRKSILVNQEQNGKIVISALPNVLEIAFAYEFPAGSGPVDYREPGLASVSKVLAITSDEKIYAHSGDKCLVDFLSMLSTDLAAVEHDERLGKPTILWLGFRPALFHCFLRTALGSYPRNFKHHLVDFMSYSLGGFGQSSNYRLALANLYGLEHSGEECLDASKDLKLITDVLAKNGNWE